MKNQGQKTQTPPKLATHLFFWFCGNANVEDLYGDLEEIYFINLGKLGRRKSNWWFWKQTLSLIFSYAVKKRKASATSHFLSGTPSWAMYQNYTKVAFRSLMKHKVFSLINIIGLALGMSVCLLSLAMFSAIQDFDQHHVNKDRIYRVNTIKTDAEATWKIATSAPLVADELVGYPNLISEVISINTSFSGELQHDNHTITISGLYTTPNFLTAFSYELLSGTKQHVLDAPYQIVITEKLANKIFGQTNVVGEVLKVKNMAPFTVTGVVKNYPLASHIHFEALVSYQTLTAINRNLENRRADRLFYRNSYHYLLLNSATQPHALTEILAGLAQKLNTTEETFGLYLQPLTTIVSGEDIYYQIGPSFDRLTMAFFMLATFIILLPACFNYANLSMARALKRSKEIGLRKVVGGLKRDIFLQFILETVILTLISLVGATFVFTLIKDAYMSMIIGSEMLDLTIDLPIASLFILFALFTGVLAGIIPAIYFAKMRAIDSLKGGFKVGTLGRINLRKSLAIFQFVLSFIFIFGVIGMALQYQHTINFEVGFDKENKMIVPLRGVDKTLFATAYSNHSEVQSVGFSSGLPGLSAFESTYSKNEETQDSIFTYQLYADNAFLTQLDFTMLKGTLFNEHLTALREEQIIVNEQFVQAMNWPEDQILGRQVIFESGQKGRVVGIAADFNHLPLKENIKPFIFRYNPDAFRVATLTVIHSNLFDTVNDFETLWGKLDPVSAFEFSFFDDKLDEVYVSFLYQIKIFSLLSFLALSISCLGMLGMVIFTSENRIKEIGIRKIMGADVRQLTLLLSANFIKMMGIACAIGIPISYFFFNMFFGMMLDEPRPISMIEVVGSTLVLLLLGGLSIVTQTLRVAKLNPVDNLRYE
ncbi:ABC transporter permease [Reichenbachiella carrageenanivorans]|uniref:ABC transporter permease n=1 Tax=Reichenbachiella carrageenanivorans TaxID=2979869 RepID=A0ABY6D3Z9_9BACT|nr:ABC transporter permease [Reichenbachiella carrageenanivorans]UXX80524.1 ABC transporter permease [Reichenbachiella carrageenanivorans]